MEGGDLPPTIVVGEHGNREARAILSQVRAFFEKEGASRFESENHPNSERLYNRAGFFRTDSEGLRIFMVLSEVYRKEICQRFEPKMVNKVLINAGWIVPAKPRKNEELKELVFLDAMSLLKKFGRTATNCPTCPICTTQCSLSSFVSVNAY